MDTEDKLYYIANLFDTINLEEEVYKYYRYRYNNFQSDEELDMIITKLLEYKPEPIDSGFNYSMKEITNKINKIINGNC